MEQLISKREQSTCSSFCSTHTALATQLCLSLSLSFSLCKIPLLARTISSPGRRTAECFVGPGGRGPTPTRASRTFALVEAEGWGVGRLAGRLGSGEVGWLYSPCLNVVWRKARHRKSLRVSLALSRQWWQSRGGLDACLVVWSSGAKGGFVMTMSLLAVECPYFFAYNSHHTHHTHTHSTPTHSSETLLSTPQGLMGPITPSHSSAARSPLLITTRCMASQASKSLKQPQTHHRQPHTGLVHSAP